jgi:hypothetical protein
MLRCSTNSAPKMRFFGWRGSCCATLCRDARAAITQILIEVRMNRLTKIAAAVLALSSTELVAHPGGLDSAGCHKDRRNGDYHCHPATSATNDPYNVPPLSIVHTPTTPRSSMADTRVSIPYADAPFNACEVGSGACAALWIRDLDGGPDSYMALFNGQYDDLASSRAQNMKNCRKVKRRMQQIIIGKLICTYL